MDEFSRKLCQFTGALMSGHNNMLIQEVTFGFKRYKIFTEDFQTTDYWDSGALTLQFSKKVSWKYFSLSYKPQLQLTNLTTCWLDHALPNLKPSSSIFARPIFFALKRFHRFHRLPRRLLQERLLKIDQFLAFRSQVARQYSGNHEFELA